MSGPRIVALIPARGGSKRIERKNVKPLNGHPLLAYTIAAARQSGIFGDIVVSSDDDEIIGFVLTQEGINNRSSAPGKPSVMILRRPAEMAADNSPDIEWVEHVLVKCGLGMDYDAFAILRPTSPFRTALAIQTAWEDFQKAGPAVDSLRAVEPVSQHPGKMWLPIHDGTLIPFWTFGLFNPPAHSRATQSLPPVYVQNASLEMAWTKTVAEKHSISGERVLPFFMDGYEGFDLNTPEDWLFAEMLIERGLAVLPEVS